MEEALLELIELLKSASPVVWAVLMKQVYTEVVVYTVWSAVFVAAVIIFYSCAQKFRKLWLVAGPYTMWDFGTVVAYICAVLFSILALGFVMAVIARLMNPEYYAIQLLLVGLR